MVKKAKKSEETLGFGKLNYILMAVGLGMIVIGFILLAVGDITGAPILLVLGYCAVLPIAILINGRSKSDDSKADPAAEPKAESGN